MPVVPKLYETQKWENLSPSPSAANHGRTIASRRRHHPPCARAHQLVLRLCAARRRKNLAPPDRGSVRARGTRYMLRAQWGLQLFRGSTPRGIWQPKTGNGSSAARFQIPRPPHIPRPGRWAGWLSCIIRGDTVPT
jgi:hypothetical protein